LRETSLHGPARDQEVVIHRQDERAADLDNHFNPGMMKQLGAIQP
jgi:hypothetical protein